MNPVVEIFHKAVQLPQDCLTLMAAQPGDSLAFGAAWMDNLERTVFSEHQGIRYFTLRDEQGALAVLPTMLAKDSLGKHVSGLSNYYTAIFQPALRAGLSTLDLLPLVSELRRHHAGLASITLAPMDPGSEAYQTIEAALAQNGFGVFRYFCFGNWYLNAPESWTGYLAGREGKLRSTIKRMSQRIAADKGRVEILTKPEDMQRGIDAYQHVYDRSWKIPEPSPDFMPGLIRLCAQQGAMRLGIVWLNDQPIAAQFWMVYQGRAEIYKLAYDEAFKSHSPGTVLTSQLMQHVLKHDEVREIDYLIGDDPYKQSWMSHRRERWGLVAYNRRSVWGLWGNANEWVRRAIKPVWLKLKGAIQVAMSRINTPH